jgi:large subunit ribosomal protein L21
MSSAAMYAVIETGGKQYKVEKGDVIEVERLDGDELTFQPVMLVNRGKVRATPRDLEGTTVKAKVVGDSKGPKITGFTYKNKSNQRKRWGHRQHYSMLEITDISVGSSKSAASAGEE